ncbi:unnamed protein product [Urochloa humidicola]
MRDADTCDVLPDVGRTPRRMVGDSASPVTVAGGPAGRACAHLAWGNGTPFAANGMAGSRGGRSLLRVALRGMFGAVNGGWLAGW